MATTASRHGADPGGSSDRATASAASRTAAAMSASSSTTSSTLTTAVMSRAARCSSRRRYAAASAATGSSLASWLATGSARRGLAPTASSICSRSSAGPGRPRLPRSSWQSAGCRVRWSARPALTPRTAVSRSRNSGSSRSACRRACRSSAAPNSRASPVRARSGSAAAASAVSSGSVPGSLPVLVRIGAAEVGEQQALGPRGVRETQPGQPPRQRGPRTAHASKGNRRVDPRGTPGSLSERSAWLDAVIPSRLTSGKSRYSSNTRSRILRHSDR